MDFAKIVIIAILVEAIWENCKMIWKDKKVNANMIGVLILSIIVCVIAKADLFPIVGIELALPYVGSILTGILASRGANFLNDLIGKLQGGR